MNVEVSQRAAAELDLAVAYLRDRNPAAADRIHGAIERALGSLSQLPGRGRPGAIEGTRELIVRGTPYVLVYAIQNEVVVVARIRHTSQDPSPS